MKKQNRHTISLSDEAESALQKLAKSGLKLSTIIERLILNKPKKRKKP